MFVCAIWELWYAHLMSNQFSFFFLSSFLFIPSSLFLQGSEFEGRSDGRENVKSVCASVLSGNCGPHHLLSLGSLVLHSNKCVCTVNFAVREESLAHRDERRDCRSASKSSHDRRTRDVDERQVSIEPERTSAREPSSSNGMRPHSVDSAASERESQATDSHSRESSVRASPRGLYVWGDDVVESEKGPGRIGFWGRQMVWSNPF